MKEEDGWWGWGRSTPSQVLAGWEQAAPFAKAKGGVKDGGERMNPLEVLCSSTAANCKAGHQHFIDEL